VKSIKKYILIMFYILFLPFAEIIYSYNF